MNIELEGAAGILMVRALISTPCILIGREASRARVSSACSKVSCFTSLCFFRVSQVCDQVLSASFPVIS